MNEGLIHLYCGDGKGKTTCAIGLAVRALGYGMKVVIAQFLKDGDSSEFNVISKIPEVKVFAGKGVKGWAFNMTPQQKSVCKATHTENFNKAVKLCYDEDIGLLILDESIGAMAKKLLDEQAVIQFLKNKPKHLEVVLTGRNPSLELIESADYVSEICKVKHPYDKGIPARFGIEK